MFTINDLKIGANIEINNEPYTVIKSEHTHMGRGGATVRVKIRNLLNNKVLEKAYKQAEKIKQAELTRNKADFLYASSSGHEAERKADATASHSEAVRTRSSNPELYHFMDSESYEQFSLNKENLGTKANLLKEGQTVDVLNFKNQPISVQLPPKVALKVTQSPPGVRGDTAQGAVTKPIILETGMEIQAPLFIKQGDIIRINSETGEYVERV